MSSAWRQNSLDGELMGTMFFTTYTSVRTAILTPLAILLVFMLLRTGGSRTLNQSTLFNKIVVVALGSVAGGAPLRPNTPLVAMVIAVLVLMFSALLVDVAYAYGWAPPKLVVGKPTLLYANGRILHHQLKKCLLAPDKLAAECRAKGHLSMQEVYVIVLEPSGTFSVISREAAKGCIDHGCQELLHNVEGYDPQLFQPGAAPAPQGP